MDRALFEQMLTRALRQVSRVSGLDVSEFQATLHGSREGVAWLELTAQNHTHWYPADSGAWLVQLLQDAGAGGYGRPAPLLSLGPASKPAGQATRKRVPKASK